jgi:hypothetical protein
MKMIGTSLGPYKIIEQLGADGAVSDVCPTWQAGQRPPIAVAAAFCVLFGMVVGVNAYAKLRFSANLR